MAEQDKEKKSILGLGLPQNINDPNAWRPSKVGRRAESDLSLTCATTEKQNASKSRPASHIASAQMENRETAAKAARSATANDHEREADSAAWRPSKVNEERLSSLSPVRRQKRLAMSSRTRLIFTAVLFACGAYFFVKVWLMPEAGGLHVPLVIAAAAMVLLFVSAFVGAAARRRRSKRADDKSILRF